MRDAGHRTPDAGHRTAKKAKIIYPPPRGVDIITDHLLSTYLLHFYGYCYFCLKYCADVNWVCSGGTAFIIDDLLLIKRRHAF